MSSSDDDEQEATHSTNKTRKILSKSVLSPDSERSVKKDIKQTDRKRKLDGPDDDSTKIKVIKGDDFFSFFLFFPRLHE